MKNQHGFTFLEIIVAIGLISLVLVGLFFMIENSSKEARASMAALQIQMIGNAAFSYIQDHYTIVASNATTTTPVLILTSTLASEASLSSSYTGLTPYGQRTCTLVLETPHGLMGLVIAEGGSEIDDFSLEQLSQIIGPQGGGVFGSDPSRVRGSANRWSFPIGSFANNNHLGTKCDGVTSGPVLLEKGRPVMLLQIDSPPSTTSSSSDVLHRDTMSGNPELNTMNTPILMGEGSKKIEGAECGTNGKIARDENGFVLSCRGSGWIYSGNFLGTPDYDSFNFPTGLYPPPPACDISTQNQDIKVYYTGTRYATYTCIPGKWVRSGSFSWGDPVDTFANLPPCSESDDNLFEVRVVLTPTIGDKPHAYICFPPNTWVPESLDDQDNLARRLGAKDVLVHGDLMTGNLRTNSLDGNLIITKQAAVGDPCPNTNDSSTIYYPDFSPLAVTGTGKLLFCVNGLFVSEDPWYQTMVPIGFVPP